MIKCLVPSTKLKNSGINIIYNRKCTSLPLPANLEKKFNSHFVNRPTSQKKSIAGIIKFAFRNSEILVSYLPNKMRDLVFSLI